ncbi:glycosyltransferase [Geojedonia litorea]|uniref:Glycosyltransferase n=1 Tax=Geojedonia litorea TaxID=1268269 RepID=A0ABV9N6R6_9FLAO
MTLKKTILVAPLNWGLGHATRCIPIINALISNNFEPIIASDGAALLLLKKEFPHLKSIELPSYHISYPKKGYQFKFSILRGAYKIRRAIKTENKYLETLIETHEIDGVISDNRLGMHSKQVPSVYITHQLQVLSGMTTWLSTMMHQKAIKNFNVCWVPDVHDHPNLSGKLGHPNTYVIPTTYIGPLSRFNMTKQEATYDVMVVLSGPEPQRTLLEKKLLTEFKNYKGKALFVKGIIENKQVVFEEDHITIYNYMSSEQLENTLNQSKLVVSRSGYTTIMDLAKLNKRAFFIPTPGQFEQVYLAKRLKDQGLVASCHQNEFYIERLNDIESYSGLTNIEFEVNYQELFSLF